MLLRDNRKPGAISQEGVDQVLSMLSEVYLTSYNLYNLTTIEKLRCAFSEKKRLAILNERRKKLLSMTKNIIDKMAGYATMLPEDDFPVGVMTLDQVRKIVRT